MPKMKGIILAGGTATRLFPLTATTSKQLLPVYDRQMVFYPLNTLIKAGIKEILIIVSPDHSGQFLNLLGSLFKKHGIQLFFEVQKVPGGLPEAFILGESFIGEDNVTLILGDNIYEDDFSEEIKNFTGGGTVFAKRVSDPERFGVVKFSSSGQAEIIVEKPKEWISDYAITGLYIYDNQVMGAAKSLEPSDRGELEITDLHNFYLKKGELEVNVFDGEWLDAGTVDSLLEAGNIVRDKQISRKFHPIVDKAIAEFNAELKERSKKLLTKHQADPLGDQVPAVPDFNVQAPSVSWVVENGGGDILMKESFFQIKLKEASSIASNGIKKIAERVHSLAENRQIADFFAKSGAVLGVVAVKARKVKWKSYFSTLIFWIVAAFLLAAWYIYLNQ